MCGEGKREKPYPRMRGTHMPRVQKGNEGWDAALVPVTMLLLTVVSQAALVMGGDGDAESEDGDDGGGDVTELMVRY